MVNVNNVREFLKGKLQQGREIGLTADVSSKCTLECPACLRTNYRNNGMHPGHNGGELTRAQFDKLIKWYDSFNLCGQVSDPIFNPDLEHFLKRSYEEGIEVRINTAATSKNKDLQWYRTMFDANPTARWTFGLDGIGDESEWYRINQDSELIWNAMFLAATYPDMKVVWQYIVFSTNENSLEKAAELALKHGIILRLDVSSGFGTNTFLEPKNPKFRR